jgi:hypothetical protein
MANNTNSSSSSAGIGFFGLLTIVFITLKLTGYIAWSWWWVLSPIWISWLVVLLFIVIFVGVTIAKSK